MPGCRVCGKTEETIPGDFYYEREERAVVDICFACRNEERIEEEARRELLEAVVQFFSHVGGNLSTLLARLCPQHDRADVISAYDKARAEFKFETRGETQFLVPTGRLSLQIGTKVLAAGKLDAQALTVTVLPPAVEASKGNRADKLVRFHHGFNPLQWVVDQHVTRGSMIGFVRNEIPKDCTGFVVTGFAKNGRSCFLSPLKAAQLDAHAFYEKFYELPKKREQQRLEMEQYRLRSGLPLEPEKPYVCTGCNKASKSRGVGRCVICRQDCLG